MFGRSTRAGLLAGSATACAALIDRALAEARRELKGRPLLLLSGGGASQVAPLLSTPHRRVDGLVLQGLGLLARLKWLQTDHDVKCDHKGSERRNGPKHFVNI